MSRLIQQYCWHSYLWRGISYIPLKAKLCLGFLEPWILCVYSQHSFSCFTLRKASLFITGGCSDVVRLAIAQRLPGDNLSSLVPVMERFLVCVGFLLFPLSLLARDISVLEYINLCSRRIRIEVYVSQGKGHRLIDRADDQKKLAFLLSSSMLWVLQQADILSYRITSTDGTFYLPSVFRFTGISYVIEHAQS